jgi:2-polyprenyl-6-methoxyphenol hydroxylase-like FAD-dependent oxidoreductase
VRGTLCQILMSCTLDVETIFSDSVASIAQSADSVAVTFAKSGTRTFDLVIGADGLHSNVRQKAFGDEAQFLRDLGMYLCVFSIPNYMNLDRVEVQYAEIGRVAAVWNTRDDATAKAWFGFAAPAFQLDLQDGDQQEHAVRTVYEGIQWEVPRLLELMPSATDWYFDTAAQIDMSEWTRDRVALVGDAAYCASPMSGQGSSLALIGAYVLAGELAASRDDRQAAFAEYHRVMRPFVRVNQELGPAVRELHDVWSAGYPGRIVRPHDRIRDRQHDRPHRRCRERRHVEGLLGVHRLKHAGGSPIWYRRGLSRHIR